MVNYKIRTAVAAWLSNATAAEATYGHISTWETGGVTDMEELFKFEGSFNEDIGAWDTSGVTTMEEMFYEAEAFNQDIGAYVVVASASGGRRGPVSLSFTVPAYRGPPAPTPAPTATTTTVTTRPHYFEDDRAEI